MSKWITLICLFISFISTITYAHEGDHGPNAIQAPKGGVIRSLETVHLELLSKGSEMQIYIYDKDLKPADVSKYPVSATVTLPKKKAEPAKLEAKGDHWVLQYDAKGAHRLTVHLSIKQGGHDDKIKWVVEPKK